MFPPLHMLGTCFPMIDAIVFIFRRSQAESPEEVRTVGNAGVSAIFFHRPAAISLLQPAV